MEPDWMNSPRAFVESNHKAWLERLRALTLEKAAVQLESILDSWVEIEGSIEGLDIPPRLPKPRQMPRPTLPMLLGD
jgi:hypothetical protein